MDSKNKDHLGQMHFVGGFVEKQKPFDLNPMHIDPTWIRLAEDEMQRSSMNDNLEAMASRLCTNT